jgi:predicted CoA-binding protein
MNERSVHEKIDDFLAAGPYAVVGASTRREKYGNKVLRAYLQSGRQVHPINPNVGEIEGLKTYPDLASLPEVPRAISIITPPNVTEQIVETAADLGVRFVWMQPGAESPAAIRKAEDLGLQVIADGSCFLVVSGFREEEG